VPVPIADFVSDIPELLARWHPTLNEVEPNTVGSGSKTRRYWTCPKDKRHFFLAAPNTMSRKQGYGCSVCAGHTIIPGVNDFATTHPELAKEWDSETNGITPHEFSSGRKIMGVWICSNFSRHKFESTPHSRARQNVPCPWCSNRLIEPGFNDLATRFPEIARLWDFESNGISPSEVHPGSAQRYQWLCPANPRHRYTRSPAEFTARGRLGCGICSGKQCQTGENDCATTHPAVAREFISSTTGATPQTVTHGSGEIGLWQCQAVQDHKYEAKFSAKTRTRNPQSCPFCGFKRLDSGFNDLETRFPDLLETFDLEANHPIGPREVIAGGTKMWFWKCPKDGHQWSATVSERNSRGCAACAGKVVVRGVNDLATKNPRLAAEWHPTFNGDLKPTDVTFSAGRMVVWQCSTSADHVWHALVSNRSTATGCPFCASPSFKREKPAIFYYLEEQSLGASKIGITNVGTKASRLKGWERAGWQVVRSLEDDQGFRIWVLEKQMKRWLRLDKQIPSYLGQSEMSQMSGATETFEIGAVSLDELWDEVSRRWEKISKMDYQDYLNQVRRYEN
jgi:hypothetical protein